MEQNYSVPNIYQDISNQYQGYFAFRFTCQQCSWQIDTRPVRSTVSTVTNIADIGIGMLGGFLGRAAEAGEKIYGSQWHQEQADALQKSWREVESHFHFCSKCQQTVCSRCFNSQLNLCLRDAPDLRADAAHFQHGMNLEGQRQQIEQGYHAPQFNINAIPSAVTPAMLNPSAIRPQLPPEAGLFQSTTSTPPSLILPCPKCQRPGPAGKFCQDCGTRLPQAQQALLCPGCGIRYEQNARFCQDCGHKLS